MLPCTGQNIPCLAIIASSARGAARAKLLDGRSGRLARYRCCDFSAYLALSASVIIPTFNRPKYVRECLDEDVGSVIAPLEVDRRRCVGG